MVLGSLLEVIVLAGDLEHSLQCMVFDVMPIVLPVSIDWCDLLNHMVISSVRPRSGGVWPKFNGSVGMWFFDHFVGASQFFVSPI